VGVGLAVVALAAVREPDPGLVGLRLREQPDPEVLVQDRLDDELGADAAVMLGVLVALTTGFSSLSSICSLARTTRPIAWASPSGITSSASFIVEILTR